MSSFNRIYTIKSIAPKEYYLGKDYKKDKKGRTATGSTIYLMEALKRIEKIFGPLKIYTSPTDTRASRRRY